MFKKLLTLFCISFFFNNINSQTVKEYIDLQTHPTMHIPYFFFGKGLQWFNKKEPKLTYKHQFKNVHYANYLKNNKGVRIVVCGALDREVTRNKKKSKRLVLKQIEYINKFAADNPNDFVVAKSPEEIRYNLQNNSKTILVHSIEGANKILDTPEDAKFWASQGVAFITLIHLADNKYGSSGIMPGFIFKAMNPKGAFRILFSPKKRRGLTQKGKNAIRYSKDAGIMIDLTHMSEETREDALSFMEQEKIPPLVTHDMFKPIQNHTRALTENHILKIYQMGGFVSLPVSGNALKARFNTEKKYLDIIAKDSTFCDGSIDSYILTYNAVSDLIKSNSSTILKNEKNYDQLNEEDKINLSIGFQTDFNGWLNHSKPRYGKDGCICKAPNNTKLYQSDTIGMAHPGLINEQWQIMEDKGIDLDPIKLSAEKFIRLWETFLTESKK